MKKIRVDVGLSHDARNSMHWLSHNNDLIVYAYEPNINNINRLKNSNEYKRVKDRMVIHEYGLSDKDGEFTFYETDGDPGCSSFYIPNSNLEYSYKEKKAILKNANIIFKNLKNDDIIELLKIDAQGSDYKILETIKHNLNRVVYLDVEITTHNKYDLDYHLTKEEFVQYVNSLGFETLEVGREDGRFYNKSFIEDINKKIYNNISANG
jgi:FkbM family methyltransferase